MRTSYLHMWLMWREGVMRLTDFALTEVCAYVERVRLSRQMVALRMAAKLDHAR